MESIDIHSDLRMEDGKIVVPINSVERLVQLNQRSRRKWRLRGCIDCGDCTEWHNSELSEYQDDYCDRCHCLPRSEYGCCRCVNFCCCCCMWNFKKSPNVETDVVVPSNVLRGLERGWKYKYSGTWRIELKEWDYQLIPERPFTFHSDDEVKFWWEVVMYYVSLFTLPDIASNVFVGYLA